MLDALTSVHTPDEILVERARGCDPEAREELFHAIGTTDTGWRFGCWGTSKTPWMLFRKHCLKAFSGLGEFDGRSGFRCWFLRITTNTAPGLGKAAETAAHAKFG